MPCKRCGMPIKNYRCTDKTCPFSDCGQKDPKGWIGHPEKETPKANSMLVVIVPASCNEMERCPGLNPEGELPLALAQKLVGGSVEMLYLNDGRQMLFDEEGKLKNLPRNELASKLAHEQTGIADDDDIVGTALILSGKALWK